MWHTWEEKIVEILSRLGWLMSMLIAIWLLIDVEKHTHCGQRYSLGRESWTVKKWRDPSEHKLVCTHFHLTDVTAVQWSCYIDFSSTIDCDMKLRAKWAIFPLCCCCQCLSKTNQTNKFGSLKLKNMLFIKIEARLASKF